MCLSFAEECYKFVHDDAKLGRFFEEDAKLVLRKQELMEKRDRLSKANAAMANIQVDLTTSSSLLLLFFSFLVMLLFFLTPTPGRPCMFFSRFFTLPLTQVCAMSASGVLVLSTALLARVYC